MELNIFWIIPLFFLFAMFLVFDLGKFLRPSIKQFKPKVKKKYYNFGPRAKLLQKFDKVDLSHKYVAPPSEEDTK